MIGLGMFLKKTIEQNSALIAAAIDLHQRGQILPDTYVLDLDTLLANAAAMQTTAAENDVHLYFMLKQLGRNPVVAAKLMELGYEGAVAVDFKEALAMVDAGIPLGNVGHLVQTPKAALRKILAAKPQVVTVFSIEKAQEISDLCAQLGTEQKLMLRVIGEEDMQYSGQCGGFCLAQLPAVATAIAALPHVHIAGLTSFPCFLYDEARGKICPTPNVATLQQAKTVLEGLGVKIEEMNMPSATCCASIPLIKAAGGTHGEPGHGLLGTTPLHAAANCIEKPAMVYVSEISHNFGPRAYCYGGGHYRRSHVREALVGPLAGGRLLQVTPPNDESIDYYFALSENAPVSQPVVMAYRAQVFVTRSTVALVSGIGAGKPVLLGQYTALGHPLG